MRISIFDDGLCELNELAKLLPTRPAPSILSRWVTKGLRGVRLPILKIKGRNYSTANALNWFVVESSRVKPGPEDDGTITGSDTPRRPPPKRPSIRTASQRAKAIERAEQECQKSSA
jgi:hypothetical protein